MKSIRFKIWISIFLLMSVFMLALSVFTYHTTKREFLSYVNTETIKKLDFLKRAILVDYVKSNSLEIYKNKPARWNRLVDKTFRPHLVNNSTRKQFQNDTSSNIEKKQARKNKLVGNVSRHQRQFMARLVLTDENKIQIAGKPIGKRKYHYTKIEHKGNPIGYIGFIKPRKFLRETDQRFIQKQIKLLSIASVLLIIISIIAAFIVSNWLTKPIVALRKSVKQLASGDFSMRVKAQSSDEVGALCYDINELAHTLDANEKSRRQWVADISHEMRTPVAVIKAQIESIQDGIRAPSSENLSILHNKIESLGALINDLYELSLSDAGALNYTKQTIDFAEFYNSQALNFESYMQGHDLTLDFIPYAKNQKTLTVYADPERLHQLFNNLAENAVRYTDSPGIVRCELTASEDGRMAIINIEDSSPGVPEDKINKIFDRLFRMETSRSRATGGAGLGLSICKNIVDAHDGIITAKSSNLGGIHIQISLPLTMGN